MRIALRYFLAFALLSVFSFSNLSAQGNFDFTTACFHEETISIYDSDDTEITTCSGDGEMDRIRFTISNLFMAFGYVVVDENDIIVSIGFSNFVDFDMLPAGTLRVYAFSTFGFISANVGDDFNTTPLSIPCFDVTDNFITVNNATPGDVTISTPSGETEFNTCPGDGIADEISFLSDGTLPGTAFIVTDADGLILAINTSGTVDFDGAGTGVCRVYAASFSGDFPLEEGDNLNDAPPFSNCGGISDNFITVNREEVVGGTVETVDGETEVLTCPGDGVDDFFSFSSDGATGSNFTYVVTDADNIILSIPPGNEANFEGAGVGACRVWGLAYEGNLIAEEGDDAAVVDLADGCFALSSNFVTVNREVPEGGTVATELGETEIATCPGDGNDDIFSFVGTGNSGGDFTFVVTDEDNIIIGLPDGNEINFEDAGVGICRVWGLSFQGEVTAELGDNAAQVDLASSCFDLSDNFVTVIRTVPDAGTVATVDGLTEFNTCPGDGIDDIFFFENSGNTASNFTYLVTDADNVILGIPDDNEVNLEGAGLGACRIWGLAYEGNLLAIPGDNATDAILADGCFSLTDNFVTANRIEPDGGTVVTFDGETEVTTCPGDGVADVITFVSLDATGPQFAFVVTDENNIIIGFPGETIDFENQDPGVCRVWGLSYDGVILASPGDDAAAVELASGCFSLSSDFVTVNRLEAEGGTVSTEDGDTEVSICPSDPSSSLVQFDSTGTTLGSFAYVIAGDDDVVLGVLQSGDQFNFSFIGEGVYRVYGLGFDGTILASPGDSLGVDQLATECFVLSDNFVTVTSTDPEGGTVSTVDGETEIFVCPGDMISDIVAFASVGASGGDFTYLVTDENNIVLSVPSGNEVDFDAAGFGVCRLWGLSYQGELDVEEGDDATGQLATSCFSLSDNFVTVIREDIAGGTVATVTGETEVFTCPGDGNPDLVNVVSTGANGNEFTYVVTDENNIILNVTNDNPLDFDGAGEGNCRIWGLAYAGTLTAMEGDDAASAMLASGCFSLSDNFITVVRVVPEGGNIATIDGELEREVCAGTGESGLVEWEITGASNGAYTNLITQDGIVLLATEDNSFDFGNAATGTYAVYGLAYSGTLSASVGTPIDEELASNCFDLTDDFITIDVKNVDACEIFVVGSNTGNNTYLCQSNPDDGLLNFFSCSANAGENYQYVITTTDDVIVFLIPETSFDFGALPLQEVRVYAISHCGDLNPNLIGANITDEDLSPDCFDVTDNFISVINGEPEAGEISLSENTPEPFCVSNGNGMVTVETTSTSPLGYATIVTDLEGVVLQISLDGTADFNDLPSGQYLIYGASFAGNLVIQEGDDINSVDVSDNCFDVSSPLEFFRADDIDGGIVSSQDGLDTFIYCPGYSESEFLIVNSTIMGVPYRYLLTDALGNIVIPEAFSNIFGFGNVAPGTYRVYGYAFSGNITASFGANVATAELSDSCYALSENFITVIREDVVGGTVMTIDGEVSVDIDLSSGTTSIDVIADGAPDMGNYAFVVTDENNIVLGFGDGPTFDFADAGEGVCRVWGLSYQGDLLVEMGDNAAEDTLATSCFELSENFVEVTRTEDGDNAPATQPTAITLSAYPNPVAGDQLNLVIESEEVMTEGQAFILDQNGRAWATQSVAGGTNRSLINFDISNLPTGLFVVQYRSEGEQQVIRFLRQ
ncbi:hypothetical protein CEQ90_17430 [Lewinellaceae bacterium SD302]|nr:hypothetical protein CEQ90_17430 [Lewinellaceae bacterium SD302]